MVVYRYFYFRFIEFATDQIPDLGNVLRWYDSPIRIQSCVGDCITTLTLQAHEVSFIVLHSRGWNNISHFLLQFVLEIRRGLYIIDAEPSLYL